MKCIFLTKNLLFTKKIIIFAPDFGMITARNIHKTFGTLEVLKGIDLDINAGEVVSIVGKSGAGKTTLLQILGTLDRPDMRGLKGSSSYDGVGEKPVIEIAGTDVLSLKDQELSRFRCEHIGFVFQFHQLLPEFSALENVMLPAMIAGIKNSKARCRGQELLEYMGLAERMTHRPAELSGGERQRVAVARALMNKPDVIFADEPSGSLDSQNKQDLHDLFFRLRSEMNQTFVIVTHDEGLAAQSDRIIRMNDGKIIL